MAWTGFEDLNDFAECDSENPPSWDAFTSVLKQRFGTIDSKFDELNSKIEDLENRLRDLEDSVNLNP